MERPMLTDFKFPAEEALKSGVLNLIIGPE
jgi:hypothetical protein